MLIRQGQTHRPLTDSEVKELVTEAHFGDEHQSIFINDAINLTRKRLTVFLQYAL
jgi:hypothetical protein